MKHLIIFTLISVWCCIGCRTIQQRNLVSQADVVVLKQNGAALFQYWEFPNHSSLWRECKKLPLHIQAYSDSLATLMGPEALHQNKRKVAMQNHQMKYENTLDGDAFNVQLVRSAQAGTVRPINALEAQLLEYQLGRYPLLSHPTEFHGFILVHDAKGKVRCYFGASDQPWPPRPNVILDAIEKDLGNGWNLRYHLHNHYEPSDNGYVGVLAPSMADAQFYRFLKQDFNLTNALITNGFHTVTLQRDEFESFCAHGDDE